MESISKNLEELLLKTNRFIEWYWNPITVIRNFNMVENKMKEYRRKHPEYEELRKRSQRLTLSILIYTLILLFASFIAINMAT